MNLGAASKIIEKTRGVLKAPIPDKWDGTRYINVIKNPTNDDFWMISQDFKQKYPNIREATYARTTIDKEGNKYLWPSDDATHSQIEPFIDKMFNTQTHQNGPEYFDLKYPKSNNLKGATAIAAGSTMLPKDALAAKYKQMEKDQALEDAYSPVDMIIAGATGGATMGLRAISALADPIINYAIDKLLED
jgi:hypothetical protein